MPHTKSAQRSARASQRQRARTKPIGSAVKTYTRKAERLISTKELDSAEKAVGVAQRALDKASGKGVIHPNNAARRKSRLMKKLNQARVSVSTGPEEQTGGAKTS